MTLREILNAHKGYSTRVTEQFRAEWERTRWLGAILANVFGGKKKVQPYDLIKFPWEDEAIDRSKEIELLKERRKWLTEQ